MNKWKKGNQSRKFIFLVCITIMCLLPVPLKISEQLEDRDEADIHWWYDLDAPSFGSAATADIDDDGYLEIVFGTYFNDEHVYALNANNGTLLWKFDTGGCNDASPVIYDVDCDGELEVILPASSPYHVYCLDGATGEIEWDVSTGYPNCIDSPPAIADVDNDEKPEIILGTFYGYVFCLNGENGSICWQINLGSDSYIQSGPNILDLNDDGQLDVVVAQYSGDCRVYALCGNNGSTLWYSDLPNDYMYHGGSFADVDEDGKPEIVIGCYDNFIYVFNGEDGSLHWSYEAPYYVASPTALADLTNDDHLEIIFTSYNYLGVLNYTGDLQWSYTTGGSMFRGAVISDCNNDGILDVIFGADDGILRVTHGNNGSLIWEVDLEEHYGNTYNIDHAPILEDFNDDGSLDICVIGGYGTSSPSENNHGRVYVLDAGEGTGPGWTMFRHDIHHSACFHYQPEEEHIYYIDAINGNDSNDGHSPENAWKSIGKVNNITFLPGDSILFKTDCEWRETLSISSNGTHEQPITFASYGQGEKPVLNGANTIDNFSYMYDNIWSAGLPSEPRVVYFKHPDDSLSFGNMKANETVLLHHYDWYWNNLTETLYICSEENPNSYYKSIEAGKRDYVITDIAPTTGYITLRDLELRGSNAYFGGAIDFRQQGGPIVIDNCEITMIGTIGIMILNDDVRINNTTIHYCERGGILSHESANNWTISNNEITNTYAGISIWGNNNTVIKNSIHHNTYNGIFLMEPSIGNMIIYNNIHDNGNAENYTDFLDWTQKFEIYSYGSDNNTFAYNLIHNGSIHGGSGIYLDHGSSYNQILNNVIYNFPQGPPEDPHAIGFVIENGNIDPENPEFVTEYNEIMNNIFSNCRVSVAFADDVPMFEFQGNEFDHNCYYLDTLGQFLFYFGYNFNLSEWQLLNVNADPHSMNANPLFINAYNNLQLTNNSSCINTGVETIFTYDFNGNIVPYGNATDIGAFEYQGTEGLIDIDQPLFDRGFRVMPGWDGAQEFNPSFNTLSQVVLYMSTWGEPWGPIVFQICEGTPNGAVLFTDTISKDDCLGFPIFDWVNIDISEISVIPGEQYVIVLRDGDEGDTHNCLMWGWCDSYGGVGPYPDGEFLFRKLNYPNWVPIHDWDFTFRTYGY